MNLTQERAFGLMDEVQSKFLSRNVSNGFEQLVFGLRDIKLSSPEDEWKEFSEGSYKKHSICGLIYQCPFTKRAFMKPRGYAGDAELIDFIYGFKSADESLTEIGKMILQSCYNFSVVESVRARKSIVARQIDGAADGSTGSIRVLSVACGHLREASESAAIQSKKIKEIIALDQDEASLELIAKELGEYPVTTCHRSVVDIVKGKINFQDLDLIYSSGLYDYLSQPFATKLTSLLFGMLKPGGKLLIANLVPNHSEVGYMETFMQWDLVYRTESQLVDVSKEIDAQDLEHKATFHDANQNVIFLELIRKQ